MQIEASDLYFMLKPKPFNFVAVKVSFCTDFFGCFGVFRSLLFVFFLDLCLYAYVCYCLLTVDHPECEACYLESLAFEDRQPGKSFDHVLQYL